MTGWECERKLYVDHKNVNLYQCMFILHALGVVELVLLAGTAIY